jgi:hypothetical protein
VVIALALAQKSNSRICWCSGSGPRCVSTWSITLGKTTGSNVGSVKTPVAVSSSRTSVPSLAAP